MTLKKLALNSKRYGLNVLSLWILRLKIRNMKKMYLWVLCLSCFFVFSCRKDRVEEQDGSTESVEVLVYHLKRGSCDHFFLEADSPQVDFLRNTVFADLRDAKRNEPDHRMITPSWVGTLLICTIFTVDGEEKWVMLSASKDKGVSPHYSEIDGFSAFNEWLKEVKLEFIEEKFPPYEFPSAMSVK